MRDFAQSYEVYDILLDQWTLKKLLIPVSNYLSILMTQLFLQTAITNPIAFSIAEDEVMLIAYDL